MTVPAYLVVVRLAEACSNTASTCSRVTPSNHARKSSTLATGLEVLEQCLDRHAGAAKDPSPAHLVGRTLHRRAIFPVEHGTTDSQPVRCRKIRFDRSDARRGHQYSWPDPFQIPRPPPATNYKARPRSGDRQLHQFTRPASFSDPPVKAISQARYLKTVWFSSLGVEKSLTMSGIPEGRFFSAGYIPTKRRLPVGEGASKLSGETGESRAHRTQ